MSENSYRAHHGVLPNIVSRKAWSASLCGKLTLGALADTRSAHFVHLPQDSLPILFSPAHFSLQISAPLLTSCHSRSVGSGPSLWFHVSIPKQKKGLVLTGKNLLMLTQKDFTALRGTFNV